MEPTNRSHPISSVSSVQDIMKFICLFCRISSLLLGPFAKETDNFNEPTNRSDPIHICRVPMLPYTPTYIHISRYSSVEVFQTHEYTHIHSYIMYIYLYMYPMSHNTTVEVGSKSKSIRCWSRFDVEVDSMSKSIRCWSRFETHEAAGLVHVCIFNEHEVSGLVQVCVSHIYVCTYIFTYVCTYTCTHISRNTTVQVFGTHDAGVHEAGVVYIYMYSLLHFGCHFFILESQSTIYFSRSLLPRSFEKRPRRLRLESEIKSPDDLLVDTPNAIGCTYICTHIHTYTHTHIRTYTHTHIHTYQWYDSQSIQDASGGCVCVSICIICKMYEHTYISHILVCIHIHISHITTVQVFETH